MRFPNILKRVKENEFELNAFFLGIFLLPSFPLISSFFLLKSCFLKSLKVKNYFKDKFNILLFISSFLIILSCIINTIFTNEIHENLYDIGQTWIGIINWIPYFFIFWIFQKYSSNEKKRKKFILILLAGSVPIIFSGLMQYFFKWHGPFTFFNGLIKWYAREIEPMDGMTGLFSNANYLGIWLNIIWPFSLVFLIENKSNKKRFIALILLISILLCTILTFSRNAWLGIFLGTLILLGLRSLKWLIPFLVLIISPVLIGLGIFPNNYLIEVSKKFIPEIIFHQVKFTGIENFSSFIRIQIWNSSIDFIKQKPFIGWGSSSFPVLFQINEGDGFYSHTHNLILEIALSYGIPVCLLIITTILYLIYFSRRSIFSRDKRSENKLYDRAWWTSTVVIFFCHMFDVQYFDIRIALTLWILLGGLRNILKEEI